MIDSLWKKAYSAASVNGRDPLMEYVKLLERDVERMRAASDATAK